MPQQQPPSDFVSRFQTVGRLNSAEAIPYGNQGKTLTRILIQTRIPDYKDKNLLKDVIVPFDLFGRDADLMLNTGPGVTVQVSGHMYADQGRDGRYWMKFNVTKLDVFPPAIAYPPPAPVAPPPAPAPAARPVQEEIPW